MSSSATVCLNPSQRALQRTEWKIICQMRWLISYRNRIDPMQPEINSSLGRRAGPSPLSVTRYLRGPNGPTERAQTRLV